MAKSNYLGKIWILTLTDFKKRDQGTVLGFIWRLLHPLVMVMILYLLFSRNIGNKIENFAFYLLIGIVLWNFFARSTSTAAESIVEKGGIISNIRFRSEIIVLSSVLTIAISTIIELVFVIILMMFFGFSLSLSMLLLPLILIIEFVLILGVSFFLSTFYVFFQDIKNAWSLLLSIGFFLTPIFYSWGMIPEKYTLLFTINPLAWIIRFARDVLLYNKGVSIHLFSISLAAIIILITGYYVHKRYRAIFPEKV